MLKEKLKNLVIGTPLQPVARAALAVWARRDFSTSDSYWEKRYQKGGNSGAGSYGRLAEHKADVLNGFAADKGVRSVIEFGSGDGNQLTLARYPDYTGVDVSETAINACRDLFSGDPTKTFMTLANYDGRKAELSLSLDVIYHLVEDETFNNYMETLFAASARFVIVYSSNKDEQPVERHVRHRKFTTWVSEKRPDFRLADHIPNPFAFNPKDPENTSFADFYVFEKVQ